MKDERDEQQDDKRDVTLRGRLRLVPAPPGAPEPPADDGDELRGLIRQVKRPTRRHDSPPDDPPRAA